jgi:hypothetical protein
MPAFCRMLAATLTLVRRAPSICHSVQAVAGGQLRRLEGEEEREAFQFELQFGAGGKNAPQYVGRDAIASGVSLGDDASGAGLEAENHRDADETFFADEADFHAFAVGLDIQDGGHAVIEEIYGVNDGARFVHDLVQAKADELQGRKDVGAFLASDMLENEVPEGWLSVAG